MGAITGALPETGEGLLKEITTAVATKASAAPAMISALADSQRCRAGVLVMVTPELVMSRASGSLRFGYRPLELDLAGQGPEAKLRAVVAGEEAGCD